MTPSFGSFTAAAAASGEPSGGRALFPCLADKGARSSLWLKVVLVLLHVIVIGVLFILDEELRRRAAIHPWYVAIYVVLILVTLAQYFFTAYTSPGYVLDAMRAGSRTHATFTSNLDITTNQFRRSTFRFFFLPKQFFSMVETSHGFISSWVFKQELDMQLLLCHSVCCIQERF